jgi:transposase
MNVVYERCCGLDVHKRQVVACLIIPDEQGKPHQQVRSFGTMTAELMDLSDWLTQAGCTHVAMESTGVYWKPIYNLFEGNFELLVVNAQHIKAVPGRKTDVRDCQWLADLLRHGLLRGSFVPDKAQRELRELTRYRTSLVRERSAEVNRLQKTLEGANIKLASVASDMTGKSAQEMLQGLIEGIDDPKQLAQCAKHRLRHKIPELEKALTGNFTPHHRFLLQAQFKHLQSLDEVIDQLSQEIAERLRPFDQVLDRLDTVPGVGRRTAEIIVAEVGCQVDRFPSAQHLASWAGMCPGNNESAGKRKNGKTRKGSPWLRGALVESARAASRTKNTYANAQYHRLVVRRGCKKAAVAVGHSLLVAIYHMLKDGGNYQDLGHQYFEERDQKTVVKKSVKRLAALGYEVTLTPIAQAA